LRQTALDHARTGAEPGSTVDLGRGPVVDLLGVVRVAGRR
jgi:hypothetical protein